MGIIVQKFGGTSVADTDKIKNVASAVIKEKNNGNDVIVVVSAMGHTTDYLVKMANEISSKPNSREMDMLLATGEQVSIALLTMAIQAQGYAAVSMNAMQVGIITECVHSKARIVDIKTNKLKEHLNKGEIVVVAGFQGVTPDGEITTLGRGGSDTSAVAIAGALHADRCDIYTDVEGVYTTDPRIVPKATKLKEISYEEMLELAYVGANVLHPRSVETAKQYQVPLRVRSTFKLDDLGTYIIGVDDTNDIAFTVGKVDYDKTMEIVKKAIKEINATNVLVDDDIAKVSIVGAGMVDRPGIAASMFKALAEAGINIKMISTSEIKISCLVERDQSNEAIKALHSAFHLDSKEEAVVMGDLPNL